jgi:peptidoglycan hydrolase CwlO-like protein
LKRAENIRNFANSTILIPEAPQKIKSREEQIVEKLEKAFQESGSSQDLSFFSVIFNAEDIFEAGDERVQNKIEEYEGYVKTLINTINRKDQEIEKLREELDLCRGNFNRLQKLLSK